MQSRMVARQSSDTDDAAGAGRGALGSQTLLRGLDVLAKVSAGSIGLTELAEQLGLTRSTTHRLAAALVERRYLTLTAREGYSLGPELLALGFLAQRQRSLFGAARPHLEHLSALTGDTVHLGVLDGNHALYLDKLPGRRRIEISSRIGDRYPLTSTGLGKALLLDTGEPRWRELFALEGDGTGPGGVELPVWLARMRDYAAQGHAFDLEENEDSIRCAAAPIRDVGGHIVGAISVSGAAQYMVDARMLSLATDVKATAKAISAELGWTERALPASPPRGREKKAKA